MFFLKETKIKSFVFTINLVTFNNFKTSVIFKRGKN